MDKRHLPTEQGNLLENVQETPADRIWCDVCGTDEFVLVERARWRRRHGQGFWDVDYVCTRCDRFYGHVVRDQDVTPAVLAAMAAVTTGAVNDRTVPPQKSGPAPGDDHPLDGTKQ